MPPLKLGFNPRLVAHDRRNLLKQLRDIVDTAVRLEFNVIELNLDSMMYELGLRMFFDADFISILDDAPTLIGAWLYANLSRLLSFSRIDIRWKCTWCILVGEWPLRHPIWTR